MEVNKLRKDKEETKFPEITVAYERTGMDYKEYLGVTITDRNYSIDELIDKVKNSMQIDHTFRKAPEKRLEHIR